MSKRLLVVNGHPDPRPERFCAALCDAYARGARAGGWEVERLDTGLLSLAPASADGTDIPADVAAAIAQIHRADRLALAFPLWLDGPPGSLRELFELSVRSKWSSAPAGFSAYEKPARVVVTMDMPAFIQRMRGRPGEPAKTPLSLPGLQSFEPIFIGSLQALSREQREEWLEKMRLLGAHEE